MEAPKGLSRNRAREHRADSARTRRDVAAVAAVYAGTIATVLGLVASGAEETLVLENGAFLAVGTAGVLLLGPGSWRASLAAPPRPRDLPLALPAAALMLAAGFAWVHLLARATAEPTGIAFGLPSAAQVLELAVLPALVEEWLCRGVLWSACERLTRPRTAIVATALLFALMHLPAWGLLGFPDHLVGGLVLGVLRARTGSLLPGVLAHLLNNLVAAAAMAG